MVRIASVTLIGGAVLLLTWVIAPAATRVRRPEVPSAAAGDLTPSSELVAFEHELDRMRARLAVQPTNPRPVRDPFRFGRGTETSHQPTLPVVDAPPPAPVLPRLVAILSDTVDGAIVRRAALTFDRNVRIAGVGDMVGGLRIRAITPDGVELADPATNATYHLALR